MSIREALRQAEGDGRLFAQEPQRTRQPARRRMYLTADAQRMLHNAETEVSQVSGARGRILAAFDKWLRGAWLQGNLRGGHFLKRLEEPPPEIWEIRVTEPDVQWRAFGRFAEPDTLIVTALHKRSDLGERGSPAWGVAMQACQEAWAAFLPDLQVFTADTVKHYVTENVDDYPI